MKPKRVLFICIFVFFGFLLSFFVFGLSSHHGTQASEPTSETAHNTGFYELPKLIPSAWYVGK